MKRTYQGSCHCGAVRYAADVDLAAGTAKCNCSICFKTRAWMAFVSADDFRLLAGESSLHDYQFGGKSIHHVFCTRCGVRSFAHVTDPKGNRSYAVRVNCLDDVEPRDLAKAPVTFMDMLPRRLQGGAGRDPAPLRSAQGLHTCISIQYLIA